MATLHAVLAPNAFKGTLTSRQAAEAMALGVRDAVPDSMCRELPMADGGDGTVDAFVSSGYSAVPITVRDSSGGRHRAVMALRGGHAVVEVANTCGLALAGLQTKPLTASTLGVGDAIRQALDTGAHRVTIGLGGSASTDGGSGMLVALGARILDGSGESLPACGASLASIAALDLTGLDERLDGCVIEALADVTSPLHGAEGAARVFAPQKGASSEEVAALDRGLVQWGRVLGEATGRSVEFEPGAGAAGGTGAAVLAALRGQILSGAEAVAGVLDLAAAIESADLVVTGEGRLDEQTLLGKGCGLVIATARRLGVPVVAVCGGFDLSAQELREMGLTAWVASGDPGVDAAHTLRRRIALAVSPGNREPSVRGPARGGLDPEGRAAGAEAAPAHPEDPRHHAWR